MKDYSAMSDFEINKAVAISSGRNVKLIKLDSDDKECAVIVGEKFTTKREEFDPCNNPADAWPIIVANKIWLRELYGNWDCKGFPSPPHPCDQVQFSDTNPLRAAMVVYLQMKDK